MELNLLGFLCNICFIYHLRTNTQTEKKSLSLTYKLMVMKRKLQLDNPMSSTVAKATEEKSRKCKQ